MNGSTIRVNGTERRRTDARSLWLALLCVACTLTQEDFEPTRVASSVEPAEDAGAGLGTGCIGPSCCSADAECSASQRCINGGCTAACSAGEDLSTCELSLCPGPSCLANGSSCNDGVQNGREPAVDCGEACPSRCAPGSACNAGADCVSGRCESAVCTASSCADGIQNGGESAVDCGAGCPEQCPVSGACNLDTDCESGAFCAPATRTCTDISCQDGSQTGSEILADCGGGECPGCPPGSPCLEPRDCDSRVCNDGICGAASCTDGLSSGDESAVDCGGASPECARCADGVPCGSGADCASGACEAGRCISCEDDAHNGGESDTDCGGGNLDCPRCGAGASCVIDDDCASQDCNGGRCLSPASCSDGLLNGSESDTDCGGSSSTCRRCVAGEDCGTASDCASQVCSNGSCSPCGDGVLNGTETDTDCGGDDLTCGRCAPGGSCEVDSDCSSGACAGGTCCGGSLGDCTRCAERLSQNVDCNFPAAGVDSTGVVNCNAFLGCLTANAARCPTRNTPGCSGDNQASDACPHNNYGGNAGTGITRANQVLANAGCGL